MLGLRTSLKGSLRALNKQSRLMSSSAVAAKSTYRTPDFGDYLKEKNDADKSRSYAYFMVGSLGLLSSVGAKSTVETFISTMSASADVLAMAKVEVNLAAIPEGKTSWLSGKVSRFSSDTERRAKLTKPTLSTCLP